MAAESTQHKLDRVRPPRVQITYDVETGGAIEKRELPFVMGVMADLSGVPSEPLPPVKDRKFVGIDRDNFNEVMNAIGPRLAMRVPNRLQPDGDPLNVELKFRNIDDFDPVALIGQVPALAKLYEGRKRLRDLLTKLDGNDELDSLLKQVVESTETRVALRQDLEASAATPAPTPEAAPAAEATPDGGAPAAS
jgi:type VI secretion system protein ImpB